MNYRIQNEVIVCEDGEMFLAGGSHSVLKYITGEMIPSQQSIRSFCSNIEKRAGFCDKQGMLYKHIIFPDKQSILSDKFPFKVTRLADMYMDKVVSSILDQIIYPIEELTHWEGANAVTLKQDSHYSDTGSYVMLMSIINSLGLNYHICNNVINNIIKTEEYIGDLGIKIEPEKMDTAVWLSRTWHPYVIRNKVVGNDGLVDIYLNRDAKIDKTVVVFGDSFFRRVLWQLSSIFTKVIFFRTRFFHEEIVYSINPDIVLTGNVERYLSNVNSDRNAHIFYLYSHLQPSNIERDTIEFIDAYRALTSPNSDFSMDYFKKQGM